MTQLPSGAEGAAAGVLTYALVCLLCSLLMLWLLVQGKEKGSYLFFISSAALIATSTSIAQIIRLIMHYGDIMRDRLRYLQDLVEAGIPAVVALNSCDTGPDKILSSMRWTCFTIMAGLSFCWSFQLMQSVYGLADSPTMRRPLALINRIGKPVAITLPIIQAGLLQLTALKKSAVWYIFTSDVLYVVSCIGGLFMLGLIFLEYIQTRLLLRKMKTSGAKFGALQQRPSSIHDRWLVVRVTIPMVLISIFEVYNILVQLTYNHMDISDTLSAEPDLSASKARATIATFIPGCVAGAFLLVCFGTTRQFRRKLYKAFVPVRFQRASSGQSMTSSRASYAAMDDDPGMLSRKRRLSMERKMEIQVTTEVEIKMEVLDKPPPMEYSVEQHHWEDSSPILPGSNRGHGSHALH